MPRRAASQKMRFSIIEVSRRAVRLVLLDFPRILNCDGRRGHVLYKQPCASKGLSYKSGHIQVWQRYRLCIVTAHMWKSQRY